MKKERMKKERKQSRIVLFAVILVFSMLSVISFTASVAMAIPCTCGDVCVNETGWWCDGGAFNPSGTPIQAAIDNAGVCCGTFSCATPCVICVKDGTYTENVDVTTANLVIKSENGADSTAVQAANVNDDVFHVTANCITIDGFTISGATNENGVNINGVDQCTITNNHRASGIAYHNALIYLYSINSSSFALKICLRL